MRKVIFKLFIISILLSPTAALADFVAYTGSFLTNTATGNQSVTGVGFQPKVVIFFGAAMPDTQGPNNGLRQSFGVATSSSAQWSESIDYVWSSGAASSQTARSFSETKCFTIVSATSTSTFTTLLDAALVSMDADGFTFNITTQDGSARRIYYLALGGSDLAAKVGTFTTGTTVGTVSVSGVGFQPEFTLLTSTLSAATAGSATNGSMSIGAATTSSNVFQSSIVFLTNRNPSVVETIQTSSAIIKRLSGSGTVGSSASFVSQNSDGFSISLDSTDGASRKTGYLCLRGAQFAIGSLTQKTSTGTKAQTGIGFTPKALLLFSINRTSSTSVQSHGGLIIGAATSTTARRVASNDGRHGNSGNFAQGNSSESLVLSHYTGTGTTADATHPTVLAEADLSSFDSDGFTLNWTTADSTARESYYIAFGEGVTPVYGTMYLY